MAKPVSLWRSGPAVTGAAQGWGQATGAVRWPNSAEQIGARVRGFARPAAYRNLGNRMKTKRSSPVALLRLRKDDIRAYAAHLFEQSGRIPNRDIENWLEAKACLEANLPRMAERRCRRAESFGRSRGFTMPASDVALWIERAERRTAQT